MAHANVKISNTPLVAYQELFQKYYRVRPPIPIDIYISVVKEKPQYIRQQIARTCPFPQVIEALAEDVDDWVRQEAQQTEYWTKLGQFKELLQVPKEIKKQFIQKENLPSILVFLFYEDDLELLELAYLNPAVPVKLLVQIKQLLEERGFGSQDEQILHLLSRVIQRKKERIVKISSIHKKVKEEPAEASIPFLLTHLLSDDPLVVQAAINALRQYSFDEFESILPKIENVSQEAQINLHQYWDILIQFEKLLKFPEPTTLKEKVPPAWKIPDRTDFEQLILKTRLNILEACGNDLSNPDHFLTIVKAHLIEHPVINSHVNKILNIEEIRFLISDETFPVALSKKAIHLLRKYPSPELQKQLDDLLVILSERTRKHVKEMETLVNAYFDIIFNSLNYPEIFKMRQALKIIHTARDLTRDYFVHQQSENGFSPSPSIEQLFNQIELYYKQEINKLYKGLTNRELQELRQIYELISLLLKMPEEYLQKEGYFLFPDDEKKGTQLKKIKLLWRSILGQYLGRLKDLEEMIQWKWISALPDKTSRIDFANELQETIQNIEQNYKKSINCRLSHACKVCTRRTCAAERYLWQIEFFLGELLDYIDGKEERPDSE